ncbi:MAG TPA: M15 family metallopeptidase [Gemmatirosa sp.]
MLAGAAGVRTTLAAAGLVGAAVVTACAGAPGVSRATPAPVAPAPASAAAPTSPAAASNPAGSAPAGSAPAGSAPAADPALAIPNAPPAPLADDATAATLLTDVRTADSTIRVELRYATPYNFTGGVLPGYEAPHALLRREAAAALAQVQRTLAADGLGLKVFDAYRPVRATEAMVAWTQRVHREDLLRDGYIASQSRHNLGVAVDLTLVDLATGRDLKMGTAFDTFAASAHTANATGEAARNRARLVRAMSVAGFVNLPEEWWHFSYPVPDPRRFDLVIR